MPGPDTTQGANPDVPAISPPQPVNAAGTTRFGLNAPLPAGANDPDVLSADAAVKAADAAVDQAKVRYEQQLTAWKEAQANAATDYTGERMRSTTVAFDTAQKDLANAETRRADAHTKLVVSAEQAASRAKDKNLQDAYQGRAEQARAEADLAKANAAALTAKNPEEIKQIQAATAEAAARAESLGILSPAQAANYRADSAEKSARASQITALTPHLVTRAGAEATQEVAKAALAPETVQADLNKKQADVDKTSAEAEQIRREIAQKPTEQQAQAAIDLGLKEKEADLAAKQQALEQAKALMPGALAAQQASTAAIQAGVQKGLQGPLYGVDDQIGKLKQMIASGQLSATDANNSLSSYLNAQITGATDFQRQQQIDTYNQNIRQQDVGLTENRLNAAQAFAGSTLGQFGQLAAGAGPGHGAEMAAGFQAALNMGRQFFGQMGGLATPPAQPSAVSQAPVVHINIGGGAPSSAGAAAPAPAAIPPPMAEPAPTAPAMTPTQDGSPLATQDHVMQAWQNELQSGVIQPFNFSGSLADQAPWQGGQPDQGQQVEEPQPAQAEA